MIQSSEKETNFIKTTRYEGYGYEIRLYQMKEPDLKDKITVKPLDPGRPEIVVGKEIMLSFNNMYLLEEIPLIKQYLCDAEMLIEEINALISEKNIKI